MKNSSQLTLKLLAFFAITLFIFQNNAFSQGQFTTQGREFILAFGSNGNRVGANTSLSYQLRFVAPDGAEVSLFYKSNPALNRTITVAPGQVYTHILTSLERTAIGSQENTEANKYRSLRITSTKDISVLALNQSRASNDATCILPVTNLGRDYYQLSYKSIDAPGDGYTIVANVDNTKVYENDNLVATLAKDQVFSHYFTSGSDATGHHITTSEPVAFFVTNSCVQVPNGFNYCDCLFEQMVPVPSWGNRFLVPVTNRGKDIIRIIASQNNTKINGTKGSYTIVNAGDFVEYEINASTNGCYISTDKPVAVASYLMGESNFNPKTGDPAMAWIPPIEQSVAHVTVAPFVNEELDSDARPKSNIDKHYALLVAPSAKKGETTVSLAGGADGALSGGVWVDNVLSGYSYYIYLLYDRGNSLMSPASSFVFKNSAGLTVLAYGVGSVESYYYLAASSARQLDPAFYVNELHFQDIDGKELCDDAFTFRASVQYPYTQLRWYIDGVEKQVGLNSLTWTLPKGSLLGPPQPHEVTLRITDSYNNVKEVKTSFKVVPYLTPINASDVSAAPICSGSTPTVTVKNTIAAMIYRVYTASFGGTLVGSVLSAGNGSTINIPCTGNLNSSTTYYVESYNNFCSSPRTAVPITVANLPTAPSITSAAACPGDYPKIVLSTSVLGVKYTVYTTSDGNTSVGSATGTGSSITITTNQTIASATSYWIEASVGTCTSITRTKVDIIMGSIPSITSPGNKEFCVGATSMIGFSGANLDPTKTTWTNNNTAIGLAASGTGNIPSFIATNAGTTTIEGTITVTPVSSSGCAGTPITFKITINPTSSVTSPGNKEFCVGTTSAITLTGTNLDLTQTTWTNSNTAIGLAASGTGNIPSFIATNSGSAPIDGTIIVTPKSAKGCAGTPITFKITINPTSSVTSPGNKEFCVGATSAITLTGTNLDLTQTTWTNSNTAIGLAASGTGNIPSFIATNSGSAPIDGTITVTPKSAKGCAGTPITFKITINPTSSVTSPGNKEFCVGATSMIGFSGANLDPTKTTWTNNNTAIGLAASGTGNIPSFIATNAGTTTIEGTITVTPVSSSGCAGTPITFKITINPTSSVTSPGNKEFCVGTTSAITLTGTNLDLTQTTWTNSNTAIGLAASGTGNIPSFIATNSGSAPIDGTITVTPKSAKGCAGTPITFKITINPTSSVTSPGNKEFCVGATSAITLTGTNLDLTQTTWTNSNTAIGLAASGTGNIPSFTATNSGSAPIDGTITVTPKSAKGCAGTPITFKITINPTSSVTSPGNKEFCVGTTSAITLTGTNLDLTQTTWTNSNTAIGLAASGTGNIPSFIATNSGSAPIDGTITVTPKSAKGCAGTPITFKITINPTSSVTSPGNKEFCVGTTSAITLTGTNLDLTQTTWTNSNTAIGLAASGTGNIPSFIATNSGSAPIDGTITVTPKSAKGCAGTPITFKITINPTSSVTSPGNKEFCVGTTSAITLTGTNLDLTQTTWTNSNTAIGLAASGTGNIPSFIATNSGSAPIDGTITVTPKSAKGCAGTPITFKITINPTSSVTSPGNKEFCVGATSAITLTGTNLDLTQTTWTNSNTAIGLAASGTGNIPSFIATNSGSAPIDGTITVTPKSAKGCAGTPITFKITINPTPTITLLTPTHVACHGEATGKIVVSATNATQYSKDDGATWQASSTFSGLTAKNYTIKVKSAKGCESASQVIAITQPSAALSYTKTITNLTCNGGVNDGKIVLVGVGGTPPYRYSTDGGSDFTNTTGIFTNLSTGSYGVIVKDSKNCITPMETVIVSQALSITFTYTQTNVACNGGSTGSIVLTNLEGGSESGFQFSKDNGTSWQSSATFTGLTAGDYYVMVKDSNGCRSNPQKVTITEQAVILVAADVSAPIACPNLQAKVVISNSLSGATYKVWDKATGGILKGSGISSANGSQVTINVGIFPTTTTLYVESVLGACTSVSRIPVTITVRETVLIYPDIRVETCIEPDRPIRLNQYIDQTDIATISWKTFPGLINVPSGIVQSSTLLPKYTYTYKYTVSNSCIQDATAKLYLTVADNKLTQLPPDTVIVCWNEAGALNLNQIIGVEAGGTWRWEPTNGSVNAYIYQAPNTSPYYGSVIFNGKDIYSTSLLPVEVYKTINTKKIIFYYKTDAGGCLGGTEYKLVVLLTPDVTP